MKKKDIKENDILISKDGYAVIVRKDWSGGDFPYVGQLICDPKDSCAKIPYCLNNGKGYKKLKNYINV